MEQRLEKNQIFTGVKIVDVNNLGNGVAKIDGRAVFVHGGVDGDLADLRVIKVASDYAVARVERLIEPSPHRIAPACPLSGKCGGCVYRTVNYAHELELKRNYVIHAFKKAGIDVQPAPILHGAESGYRNKVQYPLSPDGRVGYYAPRSHRVIPGGDCLLESPALKGIAPDCADWFRRASVPPYDEISGRGLIRHICLRSSSPECGSKAAVCIVVNGEGFPGEADFCREITKKHPNIVSVVLSVNRTRTNVILGDRYRLLWGQESLTDRLCGLDFSLSAASFYQVNRDMAQLLYQKAAEYADLRDGEVLADLFCGVGTIGLSMVKDRPSCRLIGVEIVEQAVENARQNAEQNGIGNAVFYQGDANHPSLEGADVIVIDPPRKGCEGALIERIGQISPRRVVYVSCNPDTLARDVALFARQGYALRELTPVDLFPRTGHVECVVWLEKIKIAGEIKAETV